MSTRTTVAVVTVAVLAVVVIGNQVAVTPVTAQDRVTILLAQVRTALGGDEALAAVTAISAEGPSKRMVGARSRESYVALLLVRPDKLRRSEETRFFTTTERITTFDGTQVWDDVVTGGGVSGGSGGFDHGGAGHGPGGGAPGDHGGWDHDGEHGADSQTDGVGADSALTADQITAARIRRMKMDLQRWALTFFADTDRPFTSAGRAESPDGSADVLETTDEAGRPVRYVIDPSTHLPLMVQYQQLRLVAPIAPARLGTAPSPTTKLVTVAMHLSGFKKVGGVTVPHQIDISIDGRATEAWTIETVKINPKVKPSTFKKPTRP